MSRRHATISRPACEHSRAAWEAYDAAERAYYASQASDAVLPRPERPDGRDYCDSCRAQLQQPGAIWPPDVWRWLDHMAANDYHPAPKIRPYVLPKPPKPRSVSAAKWVQAAIAEYRPDTQPAEDAKTHSVIGGYLGDDETGRPYYVSTTNGHCLLAEPGAPPAADVKPLSGYLGRAIRRTGGWVDLPLDLEWAIKRVAIFSNPSGRGIRLTIDRAFGRLLLSAEHYGDHASEYLDHGIVNQSPDVADGAEIILNAEYLLAACGCWPVRWYVRPEVTRQDPPSRHSPNPKPWAEAQPQLFCPSGTDARVLIMPMKL